MTKRIFVTATNTDIGKTYTTKLILQEFAARGLRVGAIKLIETGVIHTAPDAQELFRLCKVLNPAFKNLCLEDIVPITYALPSAPYIASSKKTLDLSKLEQAVQKLENLCDVLIMEGAGGLYVPIDKEFMMIDMIRHFDAKALLVTHCSLGCINDTLLSEMALKNKNIPFTTVFNCKKTDTNFRTISEPYFLDTSKKVLKTASDIDTLCDVLYNF